MQTVLPNLYRNAIAILLVLIFCGISLGWKSPVKVPVRPGNYLGAYKIPEFNGAERQTYQDKYIDKVWYITKNDKYEEIIGLARFLRMQELPDMTLAHVGRIANLRKKLFYKLAKEKPSLFDPIDSYIVSPKKQFNCNGYVTDQQTHHGRKITSTKIFEFAQGGENYSLSLNITFNDESIKENQKLQANIHRAWEKVLNGLPNTCGS